MRKPLVSLVLTGLLGLSACSSGGAPIKVGILHSMTGTMAISEKSVVDATLMAIDEVNQAGGLLGRKLEPVLADGKSDWPTFATEAERLLTQEKVDVVFGCWTSASRKTVKPVFEKNNGLLFYPVQYEGLEQSPNIVYTGAAPNEQIMPAVKWSFDHIGKKVFLVGSDYVFPRTANAIIKDQVASLHGQVLGEEYILLGNNDVAGAVAKIKAAKPDVILNTINGDTNVHFFKALADAGIKTPTVSFSIAEDELRSMDTRALVGSYAAWNYFQGVTTKENETFVKNFKTKYGQDRVTDDPMEAGYFGVHLWSQAVKAANATEVPAVRQALANQSYAAPEGVVTVDPASQHTWKTVRIGKIRPDKQFDIVWDSGNPVQPQPFPASRSQADWEKFLNDLYAGWNQHWANLGKASG